MTVLAIAHRAGNSLDALRTAVAAGVDVVEADVHLQGRLLEVTHLKSMGPLPWRWDRWLVVPTSVPQLQLPALLAAADPSTTLMLDLKGVGRVGPAVLAALHAQRPEAPLVVCARWWPSVDAFAGVDWARPVLSARGRRELLRLRRRLDSGPAPYGVSIHRSLVTRDVVAELRRRVEVVMTWPIDDEQALAEVVDRGANGVISNEPELLRELVTRRRR